MYLQLFELGEEPNYFTRNPLFGTECLHMYIVTALRDWRNTLLLLGTRLIVQGMCLAGHLGQLITLWKTYSKSKQQV